jgi:hypothetical protein
MQQAIALDCAPPQPSHNSCVLHAFSRNSAFITASSIVAAAVTMP